MVYIAIVVLLNCKTSYEAGNTISGVYLINPDGRIPFEVSCTTLIFYFTTCLYRSIVIWRLMVVDGLSFKEEWMVLLTSISTGLIMFMILDNTRCLANVSVSTQLKVDMTDKIILFMYSDT